ncbi:MAG: NAD(P)-dependent oxidoreductase [Chloroflexia bacterium]
MAEKSKIGLIGLGAMGLPMGRRLLENGFQLVVAPHVNRAPADELAGKGAEVVSSPSELAAKCRLVITSVPDVPQVEDALFGAMGLAAGPGTEGLVYVDMSTITPKAARDFASRLQGRGVESLDAPVSGGPVRAADGTLTIMVGGKPEVVEQARPVLEKLGKHVVHVGDTGAGQAVKLANQLMISIVMIANAEALSLGVKSGVPLETLLEVIGTSSGSNYLMQSWLPKTLFSGDLSGGFALDLLAKDLNAALASAKDLGVPVFAGAQAQQLYALAQARGDGRLDYSVVARLYEETTHAELRTEKTT